MWTMGRHQKQRCLSIRINIPKSIAFFLGNASHNTDGQNQSHFSAGISVWRPCISGLKAFVFSLCLHFYKLVFAINYICQTWWELQMTSASVLYFFSVSKLEEQLRGVLMKRYCVLVQQGNTANESYLCFISVKFVIYVGLHKQIL